MSNEELRPIIIKRKKVVHGGGHHGGAWKVAYADFVTAMMAFFLLMWLLNATTESQRKGLADYFSPVIPVSRVSGGGDDAFWGDDVFAEDTLAMNGRGASETYATETNQARGQLGVQIEGYNQREPGQGNLTGAPELLEELHARGGESMAALQEMRHVVTRLTDEGLVIDIYEKPEVRLFDGDEGDGMTPMMQGTLRIVADVLRMVGNDIGVSAHVPAVPVVRADNPVWRVTTARAQAVRTLLEDYGLAQGRVRKVTGYADREPVDDDPMALRNSRVEIVILREDV